MNRAMAALPNIRQNTSPTGVEETPMTDLSPFPPEVRELLIDCRDWIRGFYGDKPMELLSRLDAALAAQHTAADEVQEPVAWLGLKGDRYGTTWFEVCDPEDHGAFKVYTHPPHPQVNETPASLTSDQAKERIEPQQQARVTDEQLLIDCREVISRIYPKAVLIERIDEAMKQGEVVVTTTSDGRCVAVTRQDDDHRILSVIWEAKPKAQIVEEMARRFLGWRIPDSFSPDCYVMFDRERAKANNSWPIGTNIFSLDEAMNMVNYLLDEADQLAGGGK